MVRYTMKHKKQYLEASKEFQGSSIKDVSKTNSGTKANTSNASVQKPNASRKKRKLLAKMVDMTCFHCREKGHSLAFCPKMKDASEHLKKKSAQNICFRCGSNSHRLNQCPDKTTQELPFATCFVCNGMGHLASKCEKNERGLYPDGGGCRFCGSVRHLQKDCDQRPSSKKSQQEDERAKGVTLGKICMQQGGDDDDYALNLRETKQPQMKQPQPASQKSKPKVVKF